MTTKSLEQIAQEAAKECASCAWVYDHGGDYGFDEDDAAKIILAACEKAYKHGYQQGVRDCSAQPQRSVGEQAYDLVMEASQQPPATDARRERLQHVTIEAGTDARLFSATYVAPMKIYVKDTLIYDSESHPENDTTLPPI